MESRETALMKCAGQQWRQRHREQTYGQGLGEDRVGCMERVTWKHTLPYVKQKAKWNLLYAKKKKNRFCKGASQLC